MLQPNELRIGNYVEYSPGISGRKTIGRITQIYNAGFTIDYHWSGKDRLVAPILLDTEWLKKFGFILYNGVYGKCEIHEIGKYQFGIGKSDGELYMLDERFVKIGRPMQYVHQLQNQYFTLTGEELTIKETQS